MKKDLLIYTIVTLVGVLLFILFKGDLQAYSGEWNIDNNACNACGKCATECVKPFSAVEAHMNLEVCPGLEACPAFFKKGASPTEYGREDEICPTGALVRTPLENGTFRYTVDKEKCIGCGKCTRLCQKKCKGALTLVIDKEECVDCNECAIAKNCPTSAISRKVTK